MNSRCSSHQECSRDVRFDLGVNPRKGTHILEITQEVKFSYISCTRGSLIQSTSVELEKNFIKVINFIKVPILMFIGCGICAFRDVEIFSHRKSIWPLKHALILH
jgi:hypothetical protein